MRLRRMDALRWSWRADLLLAVVCCVLGQVEVVIMGPDPVRVLSAALATLPIAWRQRAPLAATLVVATSWVIFHLWGDFIGEPFFFLAALPILYSIGGHPRLERAVAGAVIMLTAVATTAPRSFAFFAIQFALLWLTGRGVRIHRVRSEQLRALAVRLESERDTSERLAVAKEHERMAAELHDTIAHAVCLMVIQAGGAEQMLRRDPDRARAALTAVQDTGRQAITELRRVLQLLRATQDAPMREPAPPPAIAPARWRRLVPRSVWADLLLAGGLVLVTDAELIFSGPVDHLNPVIAFAVAAAFPAIALRRRAPLTSLAIASATTVAELLLVGRSMAFAPLLATMVAMYSVAAQTPTRRSVPAALTAAFAIGLLVLIEVGADSFAIVMVWLAIPCFGGRLVRAHRHQAEELQTLTSRLRRECHARARLAILEERARVARDLHDSVAHAVSVMVLQAGAAQLVMTTSPERALTAISAVEAQGRQAHSDLQHLLGLLEGEDACPRTPQPSLARIDSLLAQVAQAGLPITLHVRGRPAQLTTSLDISAYRIIQEGLTNTLKHAGPVPTTVTVDYQPGALDIEIRDHGTRRRSEPTVNAGHGLIGMRERATLYGGTLDAGPCAGGGFAVRAHIPLDPAAT